MNTRNRRFILVCVLASGFLAAWTRQSELEDKSMGSRVESYLTTAIKRYPVANEEAVLKFEAFLGNSLPLSYRRFLLDVNGAEFGPCAISFSGVEALGARPVPRVQVLQNLRTLSLPPERASSLYHEPDFMGILRQDEDVLLMVGETEESNLIYLALTTERRGQVWMKTSILPVYEDGVFKDYDSEWFYLGEDFDAFLTRLHRFEK